jgi:outer membrane lipoprotein SlyB
VVATGAVTGAVVGGMTGTLAGAFIQAGFEQDEAEFYDDALQKGSYLVVVDAANDNEVHTVREAFNVSNAKYFERASNTLIN